MKPWVGVVPGEGERRLTEASWSGQADVPRMQNALDQVPPHQGNFCRIPNLADVWIFFCGLNPWWHQQPPSPTGANTEGRRQLGTLAALCGTAVLLQAAPCPSVILSPRTVEKGSCSSMAYKFFCLKDAVKKKNGQSILIPCSKWKHLMDLHLSLPLCL